MTRFMSGLAQDMDVALRGHTSLNHAVKTQPVKSDFTLNPDQVDSSRDVTYGNQSTPVQFVASKGGYELTGQTAALESARLLRYRPGGQQIMGQMLVVQSAPTAGVLEAGMGRIVDSANFTPGDSEVFLRLNSDGDYAFVVKRDGVETVIPRDGPGGSWTGDLAERSWNPQNDQGAVITDENGDVSGRYWGLDAYSGDGPSDANPTGLGLEPPVNFLMKIEGTYYGSGPYLLGFEAMGPGGYQRPWPAVAFETKDQSILNQPNQPIFTRYDDQGAGNTETFEVYGRQGSHSGDYDGTVFTPWHYLAGQSWASATTPITASDIDGADLVFTYRRKPDSATATDSAYAGLVFGLLELEADIDQTSFIYLSLDPDFGSQTPNWVDVNGANNADLAPIQVATVDGSSNDLTADGSTGRRFGGELFGSGKNTKRLGELNPVDQPTPRNVPTGVFAISTTGTGVTGADLVPNFQVKQ